MRHARSNNVSFPQNDIMSFVSEALDMTTFGPSAGREMHSLSPFPVIIIWLLWHGPAMHFASSNDLRDQEA